MTSILILETLIFLVTFIQAVVLIIAVRRIYKPVSATLTIQPIGDGDMPATIMVGGNGAQATFTEWTGPNGTGSAVAPVGTVQFTSDNTAIATVDSSGKVTAVAPGSATITGTDSGNNLSASDVLTVTGASAVSATLTLAAL